MSLKTDNNRFIRFLKNEKFIEWKLLPSDELDEYWNEYLQLHPDERDDVQLAEEHFKYVNLSPLKTSFEKKQKAFLRLERSLAAFNRKRIILRFSYIAAACVAVLVLSLLYIQNNVKLSENKPVTASGYIVGRELESEDILFITGNRSNSFQSNVEIQLDGNTAAQIKSENMKAAQISIEQNAMNVLIVPYGKRSKVTLSDGTQVWLNSGTTLEFPSDFTGSRREIYLSGEMYIEVAPDKNKSFFVHTSGYDVKVFGTKFNVSTYPGSISSVVLVEGSVSLQSADKQELFLSSNEQAIYSDVTRNFDMREVNVHSFISWKNGYLTFENTPITDALKQIERYYNLSFNYDEDVSFQGLTCTGKIILSDNLDNVMTALSLISATKYKREDKQIYIYKE